MGVDPTSRRGGGVPGGRPDISSRRSYDSYNGAFPIHISQSLAKHGIKISVVISYFTHNKIDHKANSIHFVSFPVDESDDIFVKELIEQTNASSDTDDHDNLSWQQRWGSDGHASVPLQRHC
ncbi:hypothetical protein Dsin_023046 [Dipteronia sinensis]|uniref:Uncharacterized protein n=1 Tax=Dipteronia sinensis TaxID=43782 RepID=A0AAE0E0H7_9ROSI|nr:hypothetical protein Dsin_023046 [Dipteronia sinensis]